MKSFVSTFVHKPNFNRNRKRFRVVPLLALATAPAGAALLNWDNAAGGLANIAINWSPIQSPSAGDDLVFNLAGAYTVSFPAQAAASRSQNFRRGNVTLNLLSPHTIQSGGLIVGDVNGDNAIMTLTTGSLTSLGTAFIGRGTGSIGRLNINDQDASLTIGGAGIDLFVGSNGTGSLSITEGGALHAGDQLSAGAGAAAVGSVVVTGINAGTLARSRLDVQGTGNSFIGRLGDATMLVENGADATFAGNLTVAANAGSDSSVTVAGVSNRLSSLGIGGNLLLGQNTTAGSAAGNGSLVVHNSGSVSVDGSLLVAGDPDGGTGVLHIDGGELTAHEILGGTGSTIEHRGGTIRIDGGTYDDGQIPLRIGGPAGNPATLVFQNQANRVLTDSGAPNFRTMEIGSTGLQLTGIMRIESGSIVSHAPGSNTGVAVLGAVFGGDGTLVVSGTGSKFEGASNRTLVAGVSGDAAVQVLDGGAIRIGTLSMATQPAGSASVEVRGAGSALAIATQLLVGGSVADAGGPATLTIADGGSVNIDSTVITSAIVYPQGHVQVSAGSSLISNKQITLNGSLELNDGGVEADRIAMSGAQSLISGQGVVNAAITVSNGAQIVATGDLTIGDLTSISGFAMQPGTTLEVAGTSEVLLNDADLARVATVSIAGGTLTAPAGLEIGNTGSIDGEGTINASQIAFATGNSVITATGSGIRINGLLRYDSGSIDGTKYFFEAGFDENGWVGGGAINARAAFGPNTAVAAQNDMTIGAVAADGVTFAAATELHARSRTVTLVDSDGPQLAGITDFAGGHIVSATPMLLDAGRRLSGRDGSIDTPNLRMNGILSPGELVGAPGDDAGELTVNGNLTYGPTAVTEIEIVGLSATNQFDRIVVNGVATLGGDLNISFFEGFTPPMGSTLTIMEYDSKAGNFANINLSPDSPPCIFVSVGANAVTITRGLRGDLDHNGVVDISDLAQLLSNFGCVSGAGGACPIDLDGNGTTDISDMAILLSQFGQDCL